MGGGVWGERVRGGDLGFSVRWGGMGCWVWWIVDGKGGLWCGVGDPGDASITTCAACRAACVHHFLVPAVSCHVHDVAGLGVGLWCVFRCMERWGAGVGLWCAGRGSAFWGGVGGGGIGPGVGVGGLLRVDTHRTARHAICLHRFDVPAVSCCVYGVAGGQVGM